MIYHTLVVESNGFFKSSCIGTLLIPNEAFTEIQARLFNIFIIHLKCTVDLIKFPYINNEYEQSFLASKAQIT